MQRANRMAAVFLFLLGGGALAGEPLVKKNADGTYAPALASEWAKAGNSLRLVLRPGMKAGDVVAQLSAKIAPIKVEAADDATLVFRADPLEEKELLEKLSALPLEASGAGGDSLAALVAMGKDGEPSLSDLSSDGSIRASRGIKIPGEIPGGEKAPWGEEELAGKVLAVNPCEPLPTIEVELMAVPAAGEHKAAFKAGEKILVRGFYQIDDQTRKIVPEEARTKLNLESRKLKPGQVIYGKPFLKDKEVWVLETIRPK